MYHMLVSAQLLQCSCTSNVGGVIDNCVPLSLSSIMLFRSISSDILLRAGLTYLGIVCTVLVFTFFHRKIV